MTEEYKDEKTRMGYWEDVYLRHIPDLPLMKVHRYRPHEIEEFDSLAELRAFDERYVNDSGCRIMQNISSVLECEEKDIDIVEVLKYGMTNCSFCFRCAKDGRKYVYRHPGEGTEAFINRKSEYFSMQAAKEINLDKTFVYMDRDEGWKISYFVENARTLDYHNPDELVQALRLLARLHEADIQSEFPYRLWDQANDFLDKIKAIGKDDTEDFYTLYERIHGLYRHTVNDNWPECLNHCDALAANFLISSNDCGEMEMTLIDWEYSGQGDTAQDLGSFIACSDMNYEEVMFAIRAYIGHEPSDEELRHYLAYTAIASYCWYLWAIYQESNGVDTGDFLKLWYDYSYFYSEKALMLYSAE
jgi:thiamine kinase-like enzyme